MSECHTEFQPQNDDVADSWEDIGEEQVSAQIEQKQKLLLKQKEVEEELRKLSLEQEAAPLSGRESPNGPDAAAQNFKILRRPQNSPTAGLGKSKNKQIDASDAMKSLQERQAAYQEARDRIFGNTPTEEIEEASKEVDETKSNSSPTPEEKCEPPNRSTSKNHLSDVPMKEMNFIPQAWEGPPETTTMNNFQYPSYHMSHMTNAFTAPVVVPPPGPGVMGMPGGPPPANFQVLPCYAGSSNVCVTIPPSTGYIPQPFYGANQPYGMQTPNQQPSQLPPQVIRPTVTPPPPQIPPVASSTGQVRGVFHPTTVSSSGGSNSGASSAPASVSSGSSAPGRGRKPISMTNNSSRGCRPSNPNQRTANVGKPRIYDQKNQVAPQFRCDFTRPPPPIANNNAAQPNFGAPPVRLPARPTFNGQRSQGQPQR